MRKIKQTFTAAACLGLLFVFSAVAQESTRTATVIQSRAYLRQEPARKAAKVKRLKRGASVKVLAERTPWYEVESDGKRGWVHGNAIRFDDAAGAVQAEMSKPKRSRATVARVYFRGPRGGCYYLSGSGRKVYVDRGLCN